MSVGLQIWCAGHSVIFGAHSAALFTSCVFTHRRIEQFKVVPWPKSKYGKFHTGDSYVVLNTYVKDPQVNPDKLAWDIHFWIGRESTQAAVASHAAVVPSISKILRLPVL